MSLCLYVDMDRTVIISSVYISVKLGVAAVCRVESPAKEDRVASLFVRLHQIDGQLKEIIAGIVNE
jgi:hypothetical protein